MNREGSGAILDRVSLAGTWNCSLDIGNEGYAEAWYRRELEDRAELPGTTDSNHLGLENKRSSLEHLSRRYEYAGPAWFQRTIQIPESWRERRIQLFLERVNWESQVWINDAYAGRQNSLACPHLFDLTGLVRPGEQRLTIRVSNAKWMLPTSGSIAGEYWLGAGGFFNDASTQTNWNGILGRIELQAKDSIWIESLQVYPDLGAKKAYALVEIGNLTGQPARAEIELQVRRKGHAVIARGAGGKSLSFQVSRPLGAERRTRARLEIPFGDAIRLWDEAHPNLYRIDIGLSALGEAAVFADSLSQQVGLRELAVSGTQIAVNQQVTFLRGTVDNAQFPLNGYAPMEPESWRRYFEIARGYGLNILRFHSWCPPEAAFAAADESGMWLHVELPALSCPTREELPGQSRFLDAELGRILAVYGNHPSFFSLSMGNEQLVGEDPNFLARHQSLLMKRLARARKTDPRHLYTCTSHPYTEGRKDDFIISAWGKDRARRLTGIEWGGGDVLNQTRFNTQRPETASDYRAGLEGIEQPVITHEAGQWAVYPDLAEIPRYTGLLRARNLEAISAGLERKGMQDQADAFVQASGRLSQLLYREEIEAALRTPGLAGFFLLGLVDQQGQGTSTVGALNVFLESKGLVNPAVFRQYCAGTVALLRLPKRVWTSGETLQAAAELAHYGLGDPLEVRPAWTLRDSNERILAEGQLAFQQIPNGTLAPLGILRIPLASLPAPARFSLALEMQGSGVSNRWDIWVYPEPLADPPGEGLMVTQSWDAALKWHLAEGGKALLLPGPESLPCSLPGCFTPVFWNPLMKHDQVAKTMGLLCEPAHPALRFFPTEFHSNWQWWDLVMRSRTLDLDRFPPSFRPIVQVIDSFELNRKLGAVFQARVGRGSLLVCTMDLVNELAQRPAARQLRHSLLRYAASSDFDPVQELSWEVLDEVFCAPPGKGAKK